MNYDQSTVNLTDPTDFYKELLEKVKTLIIIVPNYNIYSVKNYSK
jgi:hypothetical protein